MTRRTPSLYALTVLTAIASVSRPAPVDSQARHVKVAVEFREAGTQSREGVLGGGGIVITERGSVRGGGRIGVQDTQTRVRRSTGIFTIVQDGGESMLTVATQVPASHVSFYRDYATSAGYVVSGVVFRDVGTALRVHATILPQNRVKVRLTPAISYFSPDGPGAIAFAEAATEVVVEASRPVVIAGATTQAHEVTRRILGVADRQTSAETAIVLTATIQ
jgi:alkylated DNA nucleotide flippase Atl1